ncbi:MAG: pyridoxamine 5'-phosphate oxidase family protein [Anaerolineales bacterium]
MSSNAPSIESAFQVVEALRQKPNGMTAAELIEQLQIPRSSFFNLIQTLRKLGYVEQHQRRGNYYAGTKLLSWMNATEPLIHEWRFAFEQEAEHFPLDESLALAFSHNQNAVIVTYRNSHKQVCVVYTNGQILFNDASAAPILLSSQPPQIIRLNGYALYEHEEIIEIGMPICRDGIHVSAVLVLGIPRFRFDQNQQQSIMRPLRDMAARLSYRLGARYYTPFQQTDEYKFSHEAPLLDEEISQLLAAPLVARLACLTPSGKPHVVPVWQKWDGDAFYIVAWQGSQWADYVQQHPEVSLTIDEPWLPMRRVVARGLALPISDRDYPGGVSTLVKLLQKRYLGSEFRAHPNEGWYAFRIEPHTLRGWKGLPIAS